MSDAKPHEVQSPYQPLPQGHIRVLVLKAGPQDSQLEGYLKSQPLDSGAIHGGHGGDIEHEDGFEAVSYCWGTEMSQRHLHLSNGSGLAVTQSLYSALQAFRYTEKPRTLWADALCINQDDVSERSSQVSMMGTIYATALRVLVWLGPCLPNGNETMAFIALTAPIVAKGDRSRRELLHILERHLQAAFQCNCCQSALSSARPVELDEALAAVAKLLERPWFGRLWVVQEVALAREVIVHCGSHFASWEIFTEVARVPGQFEGHHPDEERIVSSTLPRGALRQIWAHCNYLNQLRARNRHLLSDKESFRPTALCKDLLMLSRLGCQDLHDRIYGVSRVLGLHAFADLRADYTIPVSELYRRVVELSLTAPANRPGGRAVLVLALSGTELPESTTLARPSWVPHLQYLSERSRSKHTYYGWAFAERQYYADAVEFRCRISSTQPELLMVRGKSLGRIISVLDHSACPSKQIHRRAPSKCPDQEAVDLIYWYVRCCHYIEEELVIPHLEASSHFGSRIGAQRARDIFGASHESIKASEKRHLPTDLVATWLAQALVSIDEIGGLDDLAQKLSPYITGYPYDRERNLCVVAINHGYYAAWVPPAAKPGDEICYFGGAPYPFIVRSHPKHGGGFKLVGDTLVLGLGESDMLDVNSREWSVILSRVKQADTKLKSWVDSQRRAELKAAGDVIGYRNEDQSRKIELETAMTELKSMYREADQRHQWICLH